MSNKLISLRSVYDRGPGNVHILPLRMWIVENTLAVQTQGDDHKGSLKNPGFLRLLGRYMWESHEL